MSDETFEDFDEFWAYYLQEHSDPTNRLLHAIGTSAAFATVAAAVLKKEPKLLALAPILGYGPAWLGHFLVEGNRPATFKHPLWSLRADARMLRMMLADELDEEQLRLVAEGKVAPEKLLEQLAAAE
ncbi:MAG: Mpo1-like protein [Persicimonas sp.]